MACSNEKLGDIKISFVTDESHKITNALTSLLGLPDINRAKHVIPTLEFSNIKLGFCLTQSFGNVEASYLCQQQGYQCGIPNLDNFVTTQTIDTQSKKLSFEYLMIIML